MPPGTIGLQLRALGVAVLLLAAWPLGVFVRRALGRRLRRLGGVLLLLIGLPLLGLGLAALDLARSLDGYRHLVERARVAELQCAERMPGKLRAYLVPVGADGRRGATEVRDLAGSGCTVVVDRVRFRPFAAVFGLTTVFRVLGAESDVPARYTTPFEHGLAAFTVADEEQLRASGRPDRRALYNLFLTADALTVESRR